MTLRHKTRFNTSGQGFKKDPIRYQCYLYCHKTRFNTSGQGFKKDPIRYQCYLYCHKTRFNTSGQGFKKDPIRYQCYLYLVKIALIANRVFFKTLPRSVKSSFMTKGHGQGVLKRKNY